MTYNVLTVCRHIIKFSNEKDYGISNLKLQKILYFVQAYFLLKKDDHSPCFAEKIEAWDFGPVVPEAYREYERFGSGDIPTIMVDEDDAVSDDDKALIDIVVGFFADYSATDLVSVTQEQSPWINAYNPFQKNEITTDAIRRYFE